MAGISLPDAENEIDKITNNVESKFELLRRETASKDVTIKCKNGVVTAHRVVLNEGSPYFGALSYDYEELTQFKDVSVRVMECLVDVIYGVDITKLNLLDDDFIREVIPVAYLTQVEPLFEYCWNALVKKVRVENFTEIWKLAQKFEDKDVKKKLTLFIINNVWNIIDSESIFTLSSDLMRSFIALVGKYFSGDDLAYFIAKWVNVDLEKRQKEIDYFFRNIDIWKLSNACINDFMNGNLTSLSEETKMRFTIVTILYSSLTEEEKPMEIYFSYFSTKSSSLAAITQVYRINEKKWYDKKCIPVPPLTNWVSILRKHGEQLFFAINDKNQFVAYDYSKDDTIVGPTVDATKIIGVSTEKIIYIWDGASTLAMYNVEGKTWMECTKIPEDFNFGFIFATSNKLFGLTKNYVIYEYNSGNERWFEKTKREELIKPLLFKGFKNDQTQKLYFTNEKSEILIYDPETDSWETKHILQVEDKLPFYVVESDESFVLFSGKNTATSDYYQDNPWVYYLESNLWEKLPVGMCKKLLTRIRMSRVSCLVDKFHF